MRLLCPPSTYYYMRWSALKTGIIARAGVSDLPVDLRSGACLSGDDAFRKIRRSLVDKRSFRDCLLTS